jgi:hypothetical protein
MRGVGPQTETELMRCFVHQNVEAVGICRGCSKGLCSACVVDLGHSISCRGNCEDKANTLNAQVAQSAVVLKTQSRNRFFLPAFLIVMGAALVVFASNGKPGLNLGTLMGGTFIAFGLVLIVLVQRYARELERKAQQSVAADRREDAPPAER